MANSIKRNVSKGITVALLVAAVAALCGALYAGVDAIKHRG